MIKVVLSLLLLVGSLVCQAQDTGDSTQVKADTVVVVSDTTMIQSDQPVQDIESFAKRYNPRKAILYAAVFPGSGQVYNKKYWKLPLVYGGLGLLVHAVSFYQKEYLTSKSELFYTINNTKNGVVPNSPLGFTQTQLRSIVDQTRRQRDYFLAITGLVYILQMVDAHVDAHLKEFDLNPKLQVKVEPTIIQNAFVGRATGVSVILKF